MNTEDVRQTIEEDPNRRKRCWMRWAVLAVCLAVAVAVSACQSRSQSGGPGTDEPPEDGPGVFTSYAGPVFPMTLREENSTVEAERSLTLDFAPWEPVWISNEEAADSYPQMTEEERQESLKELDQLYPEGGRSESSTDILVTDSYALSSTSDQDQTLRVLYPFAGSLYSLTGIQPVLSAEGEELDTLLHAGGYAEAGSWEDWRDILSDGTLLENALEEYPDLSATPAAVYEFRDPWSEPPDERKGISSPTIRVSFELDCSRTAVLCKGFTGSSVSQEEGRMGLSFSVPQPDEPSYGRESFRMIVVGDDIRNLTVQGYATGGWETEATIEAGAEEERYETSLEEVLRKTAEELYEDRVDQSEGGADFELYYGLLKAWLYSGGPLSSDTAERYSSFMLEDSGIWENTRMFWLEAEVTVPAGGSVNITASMRRQASFHGDGGTCSFDLVTGLGSVLSCPSQTAALEDRGQIQIVRQNFGFDMEKETRTVPLTGEEYFLEVERAPESETTSGG